MNKNELKAKYTYDYNLDVVNIEIKDDYVHEKTVELEFGVFLDFDENCLPVNLEIISASKIIDVDKSCLINPKGNVNIAIGNDRITVGVTFEFERENHAIELSALNNCGFQNSQTNFALIN